jgi:hypothetical protein
MNWWRWGFRASIVIGATAAAIACATTESRMDAASQSEDSDPSFAGDAEAGVAHEKPDAGTCPSNACLPFRRDCNGDAGDGCEANIRADIQNCGSCGNACVTDGGKGPAYTQPMCTDGGCAYACITDPFAGPMRNCAGPDPMLGDFIRGCPNQILCDPFNCGACGVVAPLDPSGDRICMNGVPLPACPSGTTNCHDGTCGQQCHDLNTDSQNCGACGRQCPDPALVSPTNAAILASKNIVFACNGPNPDGGLPTCTPVCKTVIYAPWFAELWKDCDGDFEKTVADPQNPAFNGCEVDTFGNKDNCGTCGKKCGVACHTKKGSTTAEQECDCPSGLTWCASPFPGNCVDTNDDPLHCGSCDTACPGPWDGGGNPTCVDAKCGYKCKAGYADCDGVIDGGNGCETDTQNFHDSCGSCGHSCLPGQRCGNGRCELGPCDPGKTR